MALLEINRAAAATLDSALEASGTAPSATPPATVPAIVTAASPPRKRQKAPIAEIRAYFLSHRSGRDVDEGDVPEDHNPPAAAANNADEDLRLSQEQIRQITAGVTLAGTSLRAIRPT